jgi:hypothetical protein
MIVEINGKRKKLNNVQFYKVKGKDEYFCTIYEDREYTWITPFWSDIQTKDLEEPWQARFFERLIPSDHFDIGHGSHPCRKSCYPVSWAKTPDVWRNLFVKGLQSWDILPSN